MLPTVNKYKDLIWQASYYNPKNHKSAHIDMYCWTLFTLSSVTNRMKELYPKNHRSVLIDMYCFSVNFFTVSSFKKRMKKLHDFEQTLRGKEEMHNALQLFTLCAKASEQILLCMHFANRYFWRSYWYSFPHFFFTMWIRASSYNSIGFYLYNVTLYGRADKYTVL